MWGWSGQLVLWLARNGDAFQVLALVVGSPTTVREDCGSQKDADGEGQQFWGGGKE